MNEYHRSASGVWLLLGGAALFVSCLLAPDQANAYRLRQPVNCSPGQKWQTTNPVKVRVLIDSFLDYWGTPRGDDSPMVDVLIEDVAQVVEEFNHINGIDLQLEYVEDIVGDDDLDTWDIEKDAIIIGVSSLTKPNENPAWMEFHPDDNGRCLISEAHIFFQENSAFAFGLPSGTANYWSDGQKFDGILSFRAILLHEMGHAVGLRHPYDEYAVMNQGEKAWTRGYGEEPVVELLPDDINGLRELYGSTDEPNFDVSVTTTWYTERVVDGIQETARQHRLCAISSRGNTWLPNDGTQGYCGVNHPVTMSPPVEDTVCPGEEVQLRFTLNNNSAAALDVEIQAWFSLDDDLEVSGEAMDEKSTTTRTVFIGPQQSVSRGRRFAAPQYDFGDSYYVFVRAVPFDANDGRSRWRDDENRWNNSIPMPGNKITVLSWMHPACLEFQNPDEQGGPDLGSVHLR